MSDNKTHKLAFYHREEVKFECTQCGTCCTGKGSYVFVSQEEAGRICSHLGLSTDWFKRKYLEKLVDGELVLTQHENGDCVYLDENRRCQIYAVRPLQCRTYPFWPEVMASKKSWLGEKQRCEGIECGKVVPVYKIVDTLTQFTEEP